MVSNRQGESRFLKAIETLGNKLPHPFMLFVYLSGFLILLSAIMAAFNASATHPGSNDLVVVRSLASVEGIRWIVTHTLSNFIEFPPLKIVIPLMLGIGLAEKVGLIRVVLRRALLNIRGSWLSFTVVITGIVGNIASDAVFIIVPPLAALAFKSAGRHPVAGLVAGFAGAGSGYTANFIPTGTDAVLSGITTSVLTSVDPSISVSIVSNWYFMVASVFMLAGIGAYVTDRIVSPRLGVYHEDNSQAQGDSDSGLMADLDQSEIAALRWTGIVALIYIVVIAAMVVPAGGVLRDPIQGTVVPSPFLSGIVSILVMFFVVVACVYGFKVGKLKKPADIPELMMESIKDISSFIVLAFAIAQFIGYFNWSNIGIWIAVNGAEVLIAAEITGIPLIIAFVLLAACLNLVILSGSAQWSLMAPIFVPMFMMLGYHPAFTQLAFRIADSSTNSITPMNYYLPIILVFLQKYRKDAGIGNLIALMVPYALSFLLFWILMLVIWVLFNWDVGVGAPIFL